MRLLYFTVVYEDMARIRILLLHAACVATALASQECQPKNGIHRHQPQFHIVAPMFQREANGTSWPGVHACKYEYVVWYC